jgi:hypothetical protein
LPWDYLSQEMVNEVFNSKPHPEFKGTMRGEPKKLIDELIGEAFGISTEGEDSFPKGDNKALDYIPLESTSHTDGWSVKQCT